MYAAVRGSVSRLRPSSVRALATQAVSPAVKACGQRSRPLIFAAGLSLAAAFFTQERQHEAECAASKIPFTGVPGTVHERTFIAVKPDGVQRGLVGEIIARFERKGYKLVALKMLTPTKEKAEAHYADLSSRPFFQGLVAYFSSGPIVAMCFEGPDVIKGGRRILGATNPLQSDPGTIRGDYAVSVGRNLIHGSDGPDSAKHEISNWFSEQEVNNWVRSTENWISANN